WQSIFWINVPFGVFATIWAYARLKELGARPGRETLDPAGNLLFAGGLSLALLGVTLGAITGWAPLYLVLLLAGFACLFAFVPVERAVPSPMMDLALFRNKVFSAGVLSNLLASTSRGAVGLVLVFYFQGALGLDALTAGLLLIPFSLAFVSVGPLSGYLSDKYGPRLFTTGGLLVSGLPLPQVQVESGSFMDAFHQFFVTIAGISLFGAIPAAVRRNPVIEHASSDVKA